MNIFNYSISKSSFLKFEQCSKAFFLYKKHSYLRDKPSIDKLLTFKRGHDVGHIAHQLFAGGIDVSRETGNVAEAVELTQKLITAKQEAIYEAAFVFNNLLIMVDILQLENGRYYAYEVKSSLKVSGVYVRDGCLQYYVLKNCLPAFEDLFLVTINGDYVFDGSLDVKKFFKKRSLKNDAEKNLLYFESKLKEANLVLEQNAIPNIPVGKHCFQPYQCDFFETCWKGSLANEKSIFNMPLFGREKLIEWHEQGMVTFDMLADDLIESEKLRTIKKSFEEGKPIVRNDQIKRLLEKITQPAAAMDMEIWSSAVPQIPGTRPFQQIPCIVCISDGIEEHSFITKHDPDDRRSFAEALISLTTTYKSLLVYDKTMEELSINSLIEIFPDLAPALSRVKAKLIDLFDLVKNLAYFDPRWKNNFSLKAIGTTIQTSLDYSDIQSGLEAMNIYERYRREENEIMAADIEGRLVSYCMTDAKITFEFSNFLQNLVK